MDWASSEIVEVLSFLLPGFVAAAVFFSLTSHPKPNEFERIVIALIFTIFVQSFIWIARITLHWIGDTYWSVGAWSNDAELPASVGIAILFGLIAVRAANKDLIHRHLRKAGFTKENSYPSEWYSAFSRNRSSYVVLHLKGERRLYGWPEEWPSRPDKGHFLVAEGEWLVEDGRIPAEGVTTILIPSTEVEMVEFLEAIPASAENRDAHYGESTSSTPVEAATDNFGEERR